jgi:hypothetical protein
MGSTENGAPVTTADGDDVELGALDGTADGGGDFLGALGTKTDTAIAVTDGDVSLEAGALTGGGLLLDGHDLHDLVLEDLLTEEVVDDLVLLDGEGEEEDVLKRLDLASLDETAKLGNGVPGLVVTALATAPPAATATATTATAGGTTATETTAEASTLTLTGFGGGSTSSDSSS